MSLQNKAMDELARRMNSDGYEPMGMSEAARRLEQHLFAPNVPPTRAITVTDFDAIAIGNMLAMLADRHTDAEILRMLKPKKVRAALAILRAAAQKKEES